MDNKEMSPSKSQSVRVFGSAVIRAAANTASIVIAVSRTEQKPDAAFAKASAAAQAVSAYLHKTGIKDFGSSRVTLSQEHRYVDGQDQFAGYRAKIGFNVVLRELEKLEALLTGLISAGANDLTSVTFQTTRLKELRADARRRAVAAAKEKAELYCAAAGVVIGPVLTIEDQNPESLTNRSEGHMHIDRERVAADDTEEAGALDPSAIAVEAAVTIVFGILAASEQTDIGEGH